MITDAQIHIWRVPPGAPPPVNPMDHHLKHPAGLRGEQMIAEMDAIGVDRAVVCPPPARFMENSSAYARQEAAKFPGRIGLMDQFDPVAPDGPNRLRNLMSDICVLGIRLNMRAQQAWLEPGPLDWFWADCEALGVPVTVLTGALSRKMVRVAERHPELRLTIDHMGRVSDVKGDAAFAAIDELLALSRFENVGVKMTSAPDSSAEAFPYRDLNNGIRRIYDAFGPQRMLWGSDLSGLSVPYRDCLRHFEEGLDFLSTDDKEWILGKSLAQFYRWPE